MDQTQMKECLNIVVQAERDMDQAKEDYKATTDSAFETYELTPDQIKAVKQVAKAMLKNKMDDVESKANELLNMIEMVKK